jgi:hypothetical protein
MLTKRSSFTLALVTLTIGCGGGEPQAEPAKSAQTTGAEAPESSDALSRHMRANFRLAIETRDAIVDGNLQAAQGKARELAANDYTSLLPQTWLAGAARMQGAARAITDAKDLKDAATHMAELAATCGDCHAQLKATRQDVAEHAKFASVGAEDISERMARHLRAADEMWFGLSMPSDASWQEGGRLLKDAPDDMPNIEGKPVDAKFGAQMEIVRELGTRALAATGQSERTTVYGEVLARCATCHAQ